MRVISGKYRGKKLLSPIGNDIRPTSDMVKESIFNVLQFDISGASFVDLFSGTGNIGIEAISRGAERVIFVDNAKSSLALIADNLKDIKEEYSIVSKDYRDALQMINSKVDYIFVDAPYQIDCIAEVCDIVDNRKLLNDNGYIIYEHDKNLNVQISNKWYIKKRKKFGIVVVDYIAKTKKLCAFTGSFDPITNGHINIIEQALKDFDKVQLVIGKNAKKEYLFDLPTRLAIAKMCLSRTLNVNIDTCNGWIFEYCNQHAIDTIVRGARSDAEMPYEQEIADFNKEKGNINTVFYKAGAGFENVSSTAVKAALKVGATLNNLMPVGLHSKIERLYRQSQGLPEPIKKKVVALEDQQVGDGLDFEEADFDDCKNFCADIEDCQGSNNVSFGEIVKNGESKPFAKTPINKKTGKPLSPAEILKREERKTKKYGKINELEKLVEDYNKKNK